MNKIKLIVLAVIILLSATGVYYYYSTLPLKYPVSTGGDKPQIVPPNVNVEPDAMERLAKLLPLETKGFVITFDFKNGKYIVTKTDSINLQTDFDKWYETSGFNLISKSRFLLK